VKPVERDTLSETDLELLAAAREVSDRAYAPYSGFRVGCAVLASDGDRGTEIVAGCNIENASYSLTVCAERAAMGAAVSRGRRAFDVIAIYTHTPHPTPPCGACRQFLHELARGVRILIECETGVFETDLATLLPDAFEQPSE